MRFINNQNDLLNGHNHIFYWKLDILDCFLFCDIGECNRLHISKILKEYLYMPKINKWALTWSCSGNRLWIDFTNTKSCLQITVYDTFQNNLSVVFLSCFISFLHLYTFKFLFRYSFLFNFFQMVQSAVFIALLTFRNEMVNCDSTCLG